MPTYLDRSLMGEIEFYAQNTNWYDRIELFGRARSTDGKMTMFEAIVLESLPADEAAAMRAEPFVVIDRVEAQTLMDTLWDCGLRPSEGMGSAGQLAAVKNHLEDMRRLVFEESVKQEEKP